MGAYIGQCDGNKRSVTVTLNDTYAECEIWGGSFRDTTEVANLKCRFVGTAYAIQNNSLIGANFEGLTGGNARIRFLKDGITCINGQTPCTGTTSNTCSNNVWTIQVNSTQCGYLPITQNGSNQNITNQTIICTENQPLCNGYISSVCHNNTYISEGQVNGKCGYVIQNTSTNVTINHSVTNQTSNTTGTTQNVSANTTNPTTASINCWKILGVGGEETCSSFSHTQNITGNTTLLCPSLSYSNQDICKLNLPIKKKWYENIWILGGIGLGILIIAFLIIRNPKLLKKLKLK